VKKGATTLIVLSVSACFTAQVWAHGIGGSSIGSHAGGFQSGLGHFGHPGVSHFWGFGHQQRFGHEQFFGPPHHFGQSGFAFHSFGFSSGGFAFGNHFGPAGPPPLGAPGPPPLGAPGPAPFGPVGPPIVVISSPFFCFPHGLGFTDQPLFLDHLQRFHGIPPRSALSCCRPIGGGLRWIFFGF
jgi:hypothetical protein